MITVLKIPVGSMSVVSCPKIYSSTMIVDYVSFKMLPYPAFCSDPVSLGLIVDRFGDKSRFCFVIGCTINT